MEPWSKALDGQMSSFCSGGVAQVGSASTPRHREARPAETRSRLELVEDVHGVPRRTGRFEPECAVGWTTLARWTNSNSLAGSLHDDGARAEIGLKDVAMVSGLPSGLRLQDSGRRSDEAAS
jgi:hypothetical protein